MSGEVVKSRGAATIAGAPISWVAIWGAICGATSFIPVLFYIGGGGYISLGMVFISLSPLILGLWGGIVAGFIGGLIGMLICPAAFPLGIIDALDIGAYSAFLVGLAANKKTYKYFVLNYIAQLIILLLVPYRYPGPAGGYSPLPWPNYLISAYGHIALFIVALTPLGWKYMPEWLRSEDTKKLYIGLLILLLMAYQGCFYMPFDWTYYLLMKYPVEVAMMINFTWPWADTWACLVWAAIGVIIITALRKSGLRKIPGAIW